MHFVVIAVVALVALVACGGDEAKAPGALAGIGGSSGGGAGASGGDGGTSGSGGSGGGDAGGGASGSGGSGGGGGASGSGGSGGGDAGVDSGVTDAGLGFPANQFPEVTDWSALEIVYATSHTAFDGSHAFHVPMRVRCDVTTPSAWHSDPPTAVTFSEDPDGQGGVWVTVVEPVEDITIAVVVGANGGSAPLHVTIGTPAQWALGNARYHTGPGWTLLNGTMTQPPPPNMRCDACHGANSSVGFNVMITPTQIARLNDAALTSIMTTGVKPDDVGFDTLPPSLPLGGRDYSDAELYSIGHLWNATADELRGMVLYLRSLSPVGYGCLYVPSMNGMPSQCVSVATDASLECRR